MTTGPNMASGVGSTAGYPASKSKSPRRKIKPPPKPKHHHKPKPVKPPVDPAVQYANQVYKPAETQLNQVATNIAPWFQQYQDTVRGGMAAAQQYNAPILANARTAAQNTGKPVLQNVDPNSDAAHNDVLAAAARSAIGNQFANLLGAQAQAGQTYLAGRQDVGNLYQQQARENLTQQRLDLTGKKAQAVQDYKDAAHKNALEDEAFGLNVQKAKSSESLAKRRIRVQTRSQRQTARDRAAEVNQYGYSKKDWAAKTPQQRQQIMARVKAQGRAPTGGKGGMTPAQQRTARKERSKAVQRIQDIKGEFNRYRGQTNTDPKTGKTLKPTRQQVIQQLHKDGYSPAEVQLGLKVRANEPLTKSDIATAKRLGIWPLPKAWTVAGKKTGVAAYPNTGSKYGPK